MNKNRIFIAEKVSKDVHEMVKKIVDSEELTTEEEISLFSNLQLVILDLIMKNTAIIADYCLNHEKKGGPNRMR